jgi:hypothetical protein
MDEFRDAVRQHAIKGNFSLSQRNLAKIISTGDAVTRLVHGIFQQG